MAGSRSVARVVACGTLIAGLSAPDIAHAEAAPPRDITKFACPADLESSFTDIAGSVHEAAIECLARFGVAGGTTATTFSPSASVTRGQLASFTARSLALVGLPLDPADAGFTDLGGSVHTDAINALANAGIILGRTATTFGPDDTATRAQAATIVARTIPFGLPEAPPDAFTDDEGATAHEDSINKLAAVGIVGGVTADTFDPDATLSRGAVASVIARTFDFVIEIGAAAPLQAQDSLVAALSGENEVPGPGDGTSGGSVGLLRGGIPGLLCVQWDIDAPFASDATAAHVHVGTDILAGPILLALPTPQVAAGDRLFSRQCVADQDQDLIDLIFENPGGHYVNIHTEDHPDGAARGQLTPLVTPLGTILTGTEEAPGPGETDGGGEALVDIGADDTTICVSVFYDGTGAPMAAHIHEAAPGAAGPIVVTLPPFDVDGPVADGCVGGLDTALVADIAANPADYYVNVHTDAFPDGAVRGQLEASTFLSGLLSGAEEVPGPGDDDGTGDVFIDVVGDGRLCVHLHAQGIDRVTAAHIHDGADGAAGPVVVTLTAPLFGTSDACQDADPALIADIAANPAEFYVNVHTAAFPDGAVRGQLAVDE